MRSSVTLEQRVYFLSSRELLSEHIMVLDALQREGIYVWYDFPGHGDSWEAMVKSWMVQADLIIAFWTAEALVSDSFHSEWKIAVGLERRVLVVQVGKVELPRLPSQCALVRVEDLSAAGPAIAAFMKARSIRRFFISYSRTDITAASLEASEPGVLQQAKRTSCSDEFCAAGLGIVRACLSGREPWREAWD